MPIRKLFILPVTGLSILLSSGCGNQKTYRDSINQQNDSFAQAKLAELAPAEATYQGVVHLNDSDQDFDCVLEVKRTTDFARTASSQDQSETIEVPKLGGSMRFPVLEHIEMPDLPSYSSLTSPMGGYLKVMFDSGDYNPRTAKMILPYTVPGNGSNSLGELNGEMKKGHYHGVWFSKPFGIVGTFDFVQTTSPAAGFSGGIRNVQ